MIEVMLFLLSQNAHPSWRDWYEAIDDVFCEFTEPEKHRMAAAGITLMEQRLSPVLAKRLSAA
ncbi:hypothetical protein [Methylobacterium oxalidis]|uniref:hypothetical protein n=1 Tax=Methylobacterium oxalidis TaxID=944322 RepID=UPI00331511AB